MTSSVLKPDPNTTNGFIIIKTNPLILIGQLHKTRANISGHTPFFQAKGRQVIKTMINKNSLLIPLRLSVLECLEAPKNGVLWVSLGTLAAHDDARDLIVWMASCWDRFQMNSASSLRRVVMDLAVFESCGTNFGR